MGVNQNKKWLEHFVEKSLFVVCLFLGLVGVTASKAMTLLVVLGGLAGLKAILNNRHQNPQVFTPLTITLVLLFFWAGVSSLWNLNDFRALILCIRLLALCIAGFLLTQICAGLSPETMKRLQTTVLVGFGLGLLGLLTGYAYANTYKDSLWGSYYFDPLTTLNNGAVVIALLLWPVSLIVWHKLNPLMAIFLIFAVSAGLMFLSSGASLLAVAVGGVTFIICLLLGRSVGIAIAILTAGFVLYVPTITEKYTTSGTVSELVESAPPSVKHRVVMWNFVSQKIKEAPFWGHGMDSSRHIPQDKFRLSSNMEIMPLHPHNAALQIRMELGLPGVTLAIALVLSIFWAILKEASSRQQMAIRISALCTYLSVGAVSYGVWQAWWIASAWALAAIVQITLSTDQSRNP